MSIEKKVIISKLIVDKRMRRRTVNFETGKRIIKVNLSKREVDFFHQKWVKKTSCKTIESFINFLRLYGVNGIDASMPISRLPKGNIRRIKAVSNSALSRLKDKLVGKTFEPIGRKGVFGAAFHERILEPHLYEPLKFNLRPSEQKTLDLMCQAIQQDSLATKILDKAGANKEVTKVWRDQKTGLTCKGKLDIMLTDFNEVTDLKTTAANTKVEFEQSLVTYDYDRQGGFYSVGAKAQRYRFIAVQKIPPYRVFHFVYEYSSDFIQKGIFKADFLLRKYKKLQG